MNAWCLRECAEDPIVKRVSDRIQSITGIPEESYENFLVAYRQIIGEAVARLAPNRFAVFVVGEIRDEHGFCRNFVSDTIAAFQEHGARLYNNAIMMLPLASLPMRANASFNATAKLGTCHQNILVFWNGRSPNKDVKSIGLHKPKMWKKIT